MAEHLLFSQNLTAKEVHRPIAETYLGQAHIAGTGPDGKTCRECIFWHVWKSRKLAEGIKKIPADPGYFGKRHRKTPCELKNARCNRPILNKANRLIPHSAKACRLFEAAEHVLPAKKGV
ncbi:hypothetical protein BMJ32_29655 [Sinorhizobium medicae]|nr:hypothetical protein BMJ32_29655 [Sinorhizobium medicae]PLU56796.1 hypothetical protein BMJ23_12670 [Sinorhizobium medicae]PLU68356.1 hypothetical protein BMJ21_16675 [Sinorhizobium medicae]